MVDKTEMPGRNVVDLRSYKQARIAVGRAQAISARTCRHCGAALLEGESDDDQHSGADAAEVLRGLIVPPSLRGAPERRRPHFMSLKIPDNTFSPHHEGRRVRSHVLTAIDVDLGAVHV
jgi:hypothetical protein